MATGKLQLSPKEVGLRHIMVRNGSSWEANVVRLGEVAFEQNVCDVEALPINILQRQN